MNTAIRHVRVTIVPGLLFLGAWVLLIAAEVAFGDLLATRVGYVLAVFVLGAVLFIKTRSNLKNEQRLSTANIASAIFAVMATAVYVGIGIVVGVNFKFLFGGTV